jgi:hypothetical protein
MPLYQAPHKCIGFVETTAKLRRIWAPDNSLFWKPDRLMLGYGYLVPSLQ